MKETITFNDVLLTPKFSSIRSRKDVSLTQDFLGMKLDLPIISSNMDTISSPEMAREMNKAGGIAAIHRFESIENNVITFEKSLDLIYNSDVRIKNKPTVSIGVGEKEYQRAMALSEAGATHFLIDVAHGAAIHVVEMFDLLRSRLPERSNIIVGNFATAESIKEFNNHVKSNKKPDAFKVGIGGGSMCTTRVVTGCGIPTLSSIIDCSSTGFPIIADGGIRTSGDVAKALAAGASAVMLGYMLAGTDETPGRMIKYIEDKPTKIEGFESLGKFAELSRFYKSDYEMNSYKEYRGSASSESYVIQGKTENYISPEGESTLIPYKGPVRSVLQQIEGGLRSSLSYVGALNLQEFRANSKFVRITNNGFIEGTSHGKS